MPFRNLLFLLFATFIFASCEEDKLAQYEGVWDGSYAGDEAGTMTIRIKEDGISQGVAYPEEAEEGQSFVFTGSVNEDGEITMTANVFGRDATYNAFATETELTGSWTADGGNFDGTWSATKRVSEDRFPYNTLLNP